MAKLSQRFVRMTQFLLAAIYIMLSCTAALGLRILGLVDTKTAALSGTVVLLALLEIHALIRARGEKHRTRHEIADLKRGAKESSRTIEETNAKIEEVRSALE